MNKGLTKTLMAVAVAVMVMRAMAMAPVIGDIPSPVVGNGDSVTPAVGFVYPDAIDLTQYVTDGDTDVADIVWSYDVVGSQKYRINGVDPLGIGGDQLAPGAKAINTQVLGDELNADSNPQTITIRNSHLSPTVFEAGTDPGGSDGIIDGETQTVTLYASDGTQFDSTNIDFYTTYNENDRLSPEPTVPPTTHRTPVFHSTLSSSSADWAWSGLGGAMSASYSTANGICMTVTQGSDGGGDWKLDWGKLGLVANNVYRIRATMTGSQTVVGSTPVWDLTVNNFMEDSAADPPWHGENLYGANSFFLDNVGDTNSDPNVPGANTPMGEASGKAFEVWWCPLPISCTNWNATTGGDVNDPPPFHPSKGDTKDSYIEFRVLQSMSCPVGQPNTWTGTLCMKSFDIDRFDLSSMTTISRVWPTNVTDGVTNAMGGGGGNTGYTASSITNFVFNSTAKTLTVTPTSTGRTSMFAQVQPGNQDYSFTVQSTATDDFPCPYDDQSLYLITVGLSAPTSTDAQYPPDMIFLGGNMFSDEVIQMNWVSLMAAHAGMPTTTVEPYKTFFYSNYGTVHSGEASFAWWARFKPRIAIGNNTAIGGDGATAAEHNTGGITIHTWQVDKVSFQ